MIVMSENVREYCDWCEVDLNRRQNRHDPRCPETCRNEQIGRAAWLRGQADARMYRHHVGESYNGQYELGYEIERLCMRFRVATIWELKSKYVDYCRESKDLSWASCEYSMEDGPSREYERLGDLRRLINNIENATGWRRELVFSNGVGPVFSK